MTIDATTRDPRRREELESGEALIGAYRPRHASLFASGRGVLLAEGVAGRVASAPAAAFADAIADLLAGDDGAPLALGAIPFDVSGRGYLLRPRAVRRGAPLTARARTPALPVSRAAAADTPARITAVPSPDEYTRAVDCVVAAVRSGAVDKVVLARALDVEPSRELDLAAIVRCLAERDPGAFTFALDVSDGPGDPARTLLGASPELLVARTGPAVHAHPLAGSTRRASDRAEDERRRDALLRSEKDRHEHAVVVAAVAACLEPLCAELDVPVEPDAVATSTMWHLGTRIAGRLADPATSSLQLALAVHPTPAICGTPTGAARDLIAELEPFRRDLYAGAVGWQDAGGDGEWAVTIRCGLASDMAIRLFAGAGIVAGSDAASELAETGVKLQTLWTALDIAETLS